MKNFTSCFKEQKFLHFFITRIRRNTFDRYGEFFPWVSLCGRERNYLRCDDLPAVFTNLLDDGKRLSYGYCGESLTVPFVPSEICMVPETGRVYHPAPELMGGVGLIKSSLAIELSKHLEYDSSDATSRPSRIEWRGEKHVLTNNLLPLISEYSSYKEWIVKFVIAQKFI